MNSKLVNFSEIGDSLALSPLCSIQIDVQVRPCLGGLDLDLVLLREELALLPLSLLFDLVLLVAKLEGSHRLLVVEDALRLGLARLDQLSDVLLVGLGVTAHLALLHVLLLYAAPACVRLRGLVVEVAPAGDVLLVPVVLLAFLGESLGCRRGLAVLREISSLAVGRSTAQAGLELALGLALGLGFADHRVQILIWVGLLAQGCLLRVISLPLARATAVLGRLEVENLLRFGLLRASLRQNVNLQAL